MYLQVLNFYPFKQPLSFILVVYHLEQEKNRTLVTAKLDLSDLAI
jgi:hypothetical protein